MKGWAETFSGSSQGVIMIEDQQEGACLLLYCAVTQGLFAWGRPKQNLLFLTLSDMEMCVKVWPSPFLWLFFWHSKAKQGVI